MRPGLFLVSWNHFGENNSPPRCGDSYFFCNFVGVMSSEFKTIEEPSEAIFREKMSKFIAIATPVVDEEEAKAVIERTRNKYCDARHVCWAYVLGADRSIARLNDNGEPSGTAGKPIMGQLNSFGLTNIVVCVVRYFGGIKLGTSGLIAAYREATRLCLSEAQIVERVEETELVLTFGYVVMNDVMKLVKGLGLRILSQDFDNTCRLTVAVRRDEGRQLADRFASTVEGLDADLKE